MNEPSGLSRRGLLASAGAVLAGASLTGCENTTTPVATAEGTGGPGIMGDETAGGPVDAAGIPLARRDYPVTLPRIGDPVKAGAPEKGGELQVYNYADYLNPEVIQAFGKQEGVSVRVTTFQSLDEAFTKLSTGRFQFDVVFTAPDHLPRLVGRRLVQPLNFDLIPNLVKETWPELHSPFYDVGPRYSVPYTLYTTGIGWRNDQIGALDPNALGWEAFWESQALRGKVAVLDDAREALGMALMRRGVSNLNTEDEAALKRASDDLVELNDITRVKVAINGYETLPAGRMTMNHVWSGDMLNAVISYLPEGTSGDVLSYWYQKVGGPVFNDCMCVGVEARKPVMAHRFLNFLLRPDVALTNFTGYVGYQPPITKIDAAALFEQQVLPANLRNCVVTREDYANGNAYLALTAEGRRRWDQAWGAFRNG
ncbi:spermidine/putrescine ABC transporter substrate-binding protein [Solirubrobacter sp. CPCC 204708]|uniref:Spermidine/putrescine ABC transporter substrate-binding protein n=1 Tax=Solirubrobacter deserti TaxID=2282478 RepID=A0ABT4RC72_9ACTN|nr:spermidine/putrescine ABC transporter substrate-binding protein [Solirubrobacter deserti]MBE2315498.1 spermidine/putrescine ABC transporter substrate-binding protein [Solirubrobacter deserti]MDA0136137.1 spermidine/putrescine ABC transporter substrate-binding protein [Solirubrobacter deserti]